jgi:hypothetical protein
MMGTETRHRKTTPQPRGAPSNARNEGKQLLESFKLLMVHFDHFGAKQTQEDFSLPRPKTIKNTVNADSRASIDNTLRLSLA